MQQYRPDIDGLRAVAVLLVLLFHADLGVPGGYVGVDVFFVISGYLITGIIKSGLEMGKFSLGDFWRRRISRIAPASMVTVLATVGVGAILLLPEDLSELASSGVAQQFLLANTYFSARVSYFDGPSDLKPLLHMWSLAVEEQFYLFYPFLMVLLFRAGGRLLPWAIVILGALSLGFSVIQLPRNPDDAFFLLPSRSWELLLGAIVHWIPAIRAGRRGVSEAVSAFGLACIVIPAVLYSKATPFPAAAAIPPCLGTALIILAGRTRAGVVARTLSLRPLVFIGLISYSLYLFHWPLLAYLRYELGNELPLAIRLAAIPASIVMAAVSWWAIEVPVRRFGSAQPARLVMASFLMLTLVVSGGLASIRILDGLPGRLSPEARAVLDTPPVDDSVKRSTKQVERNELPLLGECGDRVDCLVWGDSHAAAVIGAVEHVAESLEICCALASRNATVPLVGTWRRGQEVAACEWSDAIVDYVRRNKVPVVVLVSRWSVNVEGESGSDRRGLILDAESSTGDPDSSARVLLRGLMRTIEVLRESGASVILVDQFPEHQIDPRRIMIKEILTGQPSSHATTRRQHDERMTRVDSAFSEIRDRDGVTVVDPAEAMFSGSDPDAKAAVGDAGGAYYVDTNHPSRHAAATVLGPMLKKAIREALERVPP